MTTDVLDLVLETHQTNSNADQRVEFTQQVRAELLKAVLSNPANMQTPQMLTIALKAASDMDKSEFTKQRLKQDQSDAASRNELMREFYAEMVKERGKELDIRNVNQSQQLPVLTSEAITLPDDEFTIDAGELIIGNDTENSIV